MDSANVHVSESADVIGLGESSHGPTTKPAKRLEDLAKAWKKVQGNDGTWPLRVAAEVCSVVENWSAYADQADGKTASAYLKTIFGEGGAGRVQWWKARRDAVQVLGEVARRKIHHETAIALAGLPESERAECLKRILERTVQQGGALLTTAQSKKIIGEVRGVQGATRTCAKCTEKNKRIAELEAELVTLRAQRH